MRLLIRADASTQIGTGHVMRCLALAQAWDEAGGKAQFALAQETSPLEARLSAEGMDVLRLDVSPGSALDAAQTVALAQELGAAWVVVDGYHFGTTYQQAIKVAGLRLLFVDDYGHADHYYADLVLNQNISADTSWYDNREPYTRLLLGTRYALLRREFWSWQGWKRKIPNVARKVLITLGGSDPENVTFSALEALENVGMTDLEAVVVVGGSNPHRQNIKSRVDRMPFSIRLVENTSNMPELMAWADLAISAGGSTCWELAFMGLPNLIQILADNQRQIAAGLEAAGVAVNLGWHQDTSIAELSRKLNELIESTLTRVEMSRLGRKCVDGTGVQRVIAQLTGGNGS